MSLGSKVHPLATALKPWYPWLASKVVTLNEEPVRAIRTSEHPKLWWLLSPPHYLYEVVTVGWLG
jgi:hypothetical protein